MGAASEPPENRGDAPPLLAGIEAPSTVKDQPAVEAPTADEPPPVVNAMSGTEQEKPAATAPERSEPPRASPSTAASDAGAMPRGVDKQPRGNAKPAGGAVTATDSNSSALVVLLVALIALGFFVFRALN
jgi:hypothetical protein